MKDLWALQRYSSRSEWPLKKGWQIWLTYEHRRRAEIECALRVDEIRPEDRFKVKYRVVKI